MFHAKLPQVNSMDGHWIYINILTMRSMHADFQLRTFSDEGWLQDSEQAMHGGLASGSGIRLDHLIKQAVVVVVACKSRVVVYIFHH